MIISRTPLRMSFFGGGSDLKEYYKTGYGSVLSTSIDKYIYMTVNTKFSDKIRICYSKTESVSDIKQIKHNLVREALRVVGINQGGLDIVYMSDMLPDHEGSGLGASSSLTVGILHALFTFKGQKVSIEKLASLACNIEIDVLGHPIGKQDQYAAAFGGFNRINFNADETVDVIPLNLNKKTIKNLNQNIICFHIGKNTRSDTILDEQTKNTHLNISEIDKMISFVDDGIELLKNSRLNDFGDLLDMSWNIKKGLATNISNSDIDKAYSMAKDAGARGGKILGSGGGGFLMFFCETKYQDILRNKLGYLKEADLKFSSGGSQIIYDG